MSWCQVKCTHRLMCLSFDPGLIEQRANDILKTYLTLKKEEEERLSAAAAAAALHSKSHASATAKSMANILGEQGWTRRKGLSRDPLIRAPFLHVVGSTTRGMCAIGVCVVARI